MSGWNWARPRDAIGAARAALALTGVGAAVAVLSTLPALLRGQTPLAQTMIVCAGAAVVVGLAVGLRKVPAGSRWWAAVPAGWLILTLVLTLGQHDPQRRAAIFALVPAVYAARQLHRRAAFVVIGSSAAVAAVACLVARPFVPGVLDALYLDAVLLVLGTRLTVSGTRLVTRMSRLEQEAAVDPLTGLVTRRALDQALRAGLRPCTTGAGMALVLLDVDNFKSVNDQLGHPAGDAVLVQLAELLRRGTRPADLASRLGGDEIAALLMDVTPSIAARRAESLRSDVEAHAFVLAGGASTTVTVSVGVAHAAVGGADASDLYTCADAALYEAKRRGRNQVAVAARTTEPTRATRI